MNIGAESERDVGVTQPRRDAGNGYTLQVHQSGAGVSRIVEADLRHIETADGRLPQRAEGRRVVRLGYAVTVHSAQGVTADTTHAVLSEAATRALFYVATSRGRDANSAYLYEHPVERGYDHQQIDGVQSAERGTSRQAMIARSSDHRQ